MKTRRLPAVVVALAAAVSLVACGGQQEPPASGSASGGRLTIATGNTTGVYYQLGGAYASVISEKMSGYRATASETGASVQNVQGLVGGNYDIAFSLGDTAADAVNGVNSFQSKQDVVALTRLYNNFTQVAVRTSANINSIADLKGKRVSTGSPNSGTEVIARRLLEAAGLDPAKDVTAQRLGLPESVDAMKSGSIDALVWSGGLPTGGITDLTTSLGKGVKLLSITDLLPKMTEKYGSVYSEAPIPAATYKQPADVSTIVVPNVLLVRKDMKDELAEQLTKTLYENLDALVAVNAAAKGIDKANAAKTDPVPLHPGAQKALDALK
ncbi:TAXI family TRAP transporter solute-binding subunit [Kribbella sandramycini]|uniref:TAXI family TRAP transporter solute-binding subunit n=1 Tax=Kribbella sandramycini TaxID=60450 RepID=A0A7Y4L280_9ACTN|nr:TAXI family TRAP transporter solute-binding subunit [Kribbella sandramycini]MBB6566387.1 TRAP transporter TAXI family solute receptor [Kribbella sandramycini]NOL42953.1 TAXI family TRAP transporter solute-binding subunit [Kribbella sandramycini]